MNKLTVIKSAINFPITIGVGGIVDGVVKNNVYVEKRVQKALVWCGRVGITIAVQQIVKERVNKEIDDIVTAWNERRSQ